MNLNKAELIGNMTANPEVKSLPSGQSIASFSIATNYTWRDAKTKEKQKNTEFHSVIAWGKLAGVVEKYLKKGDKVYIDGRLHTRSWEGKDKVKRSKTEIIAQNLIMLGGARDKSDDKATQANEEIIVEEINVDKASVNNK